MILYILHYDCVAHFLIKSDVTSTSVKMSPSPSLSVRYPSNVSVFSCLLSAVCFFCFFTAQSEEELTLGEDTDVTFPLEQASSEQASLPHLSPAPCFLISKGTWTESEVA